MDILARFLMFFGGAFLGVAVITMSFLRRRMIKHAKKVKNKRRGLFR